MKTMCLLLLTMSWATLTHEMGYAVLLRAEPALECGSGAAAFDWGACPAAGKAVAALPHSKARAFGPRPLAWGEGGPQPALSPAGAGRAFARPRITDAQGTQPATARLVSPRLREARRRVRGHSAPAPQKANRSKQLPSNRQASLPGNALNHHQPGSDKSGGAAKSGFIRSQTVNNPLAVRTPNVARPNAPSFNSVRHHSPNAAVVGGSTDFHSSNTAAINGTGMNRKP
jgi:hypothetical protein